MGSWKFSWPKIFWEVANEGLVRDSLLNMKQSWWSLLGRGTTQLMLNEYLRLVPRYFQGYFPGRFSGFPWPMVKSMHHC